MVDLRVYSRGRCTREMMRITKLVIISAALLSVAPIGASAQRSGAKAPQKTVIARSDVRELPADQQIIQALGRLTFGARPGDVQKIRAIGLDNWIDQQLQPNKINDDAMSAFVSRYSALNQDQNDLLRQYAQQQQQRREVKRDRADSTKGMTADDSAMLMQLRQQQNSRRQVVTQLQSSRVARAVASERQLQEVMTDFWENHFNIYAAKGAPEPYYLLDFDQNVIRPNALGKFRDLLEAVAKSPAMLFYLDNARSMADSTEPTLQRAQRFPRIGRAPLGRRGIGAILGGIGTMPRPQQQQQQRQRQGLNEKYGRELLELHTLGVDGGYTQQDVINVARAFTGWTIDPRSGSFRFVPALHDAGEKVVLGHKIKAGGGMDDGEKVLDI